MKKLGLSLLIIGLAIMLFAGFQFFTRENVLDVGDLHITQRTKHTADWSPIAGIGVMALGAFLLLFGPKKV